MRTILAFALLIGPSCSYAGDPIPDQIPKDVLAWRHECDKASNQCRIEKIVDFKSASGIEQGGVALSYDKAKQQPEFIAIVVPRNVPKGSDVTIRFVDSVQRDGKWTLEPIGDFLGLPISGCDETSCQALVHPQIPDGPNLYEAFKVRRFLWIMFKRNGNLERIVVPLPGMNEELRKIAVEI